MSGNSEEKEEIFIDSNIFLYSYSTHKLANRCSSFLSGVEEGEFKGFVNSVVVDEVFYKSIVAEVMTKKNIALKNIPSYIKSNPSVLKTLKNPYSVIEDILSKENIAVLDSSKTLGKITRFVKDYTLLPSDALVATTCKGYDHKDRNIRQRFRKSGFFRNYQAMNDLLLCALFSA